MLKKYRVIKGQLHKIFYHKSKKSHKFLKEILKKRSLTSSKWKIVYYLFLLNILPLKKLNLEMKGDLVLLSFRKKEFDFENKRVYTGALDEKGKRDIETEIKIKNMIYKNNLKINTPKVLDFENGRTMVEEFIDVKSISLKEKSYIIDAFSQLCEFYNYVMIKKSTFKNEANKIDLKELENDDIIKQAKSKLQIDGEVFMTTIHGDLTISNLGKTNGKTYIFDWGSFREDTLLGDLVWMITHSNLLNKQAKQTLSLILEVLDIIYVKTGVKIDIQTFKLYFILSMLRNIKREMNLNNSKAVYESLKTLKSLL